MRIENATPAQIQFVSEWMRERDYAELSAVYFAETREQLVEDLTFLYSRSDEMLCASWNGTPVAVGGFFLVRPRTCILGMWATDLFPRIGLGLTRFLRRQLMPRFVAAGVHRFECASMAGYTQAHDWLRTLGLKEEAQMPKYGKNGETFVLFSKVVHESQVGSRGGH